MANCPSCQHLNGPDAAFCVKCGASLASGPPAGPPPGPTSVLPPITATMASPPPGSPAPPPPASPPGGGSPALLAVAIGVGVLAAIALIVVIVLAVRGGDNGDEVVTGDTSAPTFDDATSVPPATRPSTTRPPATSPPSNPADPTQLEGGLLCRDLDARGYNYAEAVAYWADEGRPDRMDEDLNGYPCETVYPSSEVVAYWGFDPQQGGGGGSSVYDLPSGLYCRDLRARGFSYADAVAYWNLEGQPSRMVAQTLPCQTVYPASDVTAYWGQGD